MHVEPLSPVAGWMRPYFFVLHPNPRRSIDQIIEVLSTKGIAARDEVSRSSIHRLLESKIDHGTTVMVSLPGKYEPELSN